MKKRSDRELLADDLYRDIYNELISLCRGLAKDMATASNRFLCSDDIESKRISLDEALSVYDDYSKMIRGYNRIFESINKADMTEEEIRTLLYYSKKGLIKATYDTLIARGYDVVVMTDKDVMNGVLIVATVVSVTG